MNLVDLNEFNEATKEIFDLLEMGIHFANSE